MWGISPELIPDRCFLLHVTTEEHHCRGLLQTSCDSINIREGCRKCVAVDCGEVSELADEHDYCIGNLYPKKMLGNYSSWGDVIPPDRRHTVARCPVVKI